MLQEKGGIETLKDTIGGASNSQASKLTESGARPEVRGKFLYVDGEKFYVKGVTYGTFAENPETQGYPDPSRVSQDFAAMAAIGLNAVRVYTVPPRWLLDTAAEHGMCVLVGLPWEQHVAFLNIPGRDEEILARLKPDIETVAGHPALLAIAIGNEIPASVVRWHGARRTSRFLGRLAALVRRIDPGALVTYVNFPTTEYLDLGCVDFVSFNVYLEHMDRLDAYLARLHNLATEKPLLMAEIGLDSQRNGLDVQATSLRAQIETVFEAGVAGAFIFAWTDEWARGGHEIDDWDFGLTTRDRQPKPALEAVAEAFAQVPAADRDWPAMSVVVCSYNGARTIGETLEHLSELDYPEYEVIVVNDGSKDETRAIAEASGFRVISTENRGLSAARNTGLDASKGEFVVYIDDDAYPDRDWLKYLAVTFDKGGYAAVGGPNIGPPEDGDTAECVANAPGGPVQVLVSDDIAEHIPGCNMAFRAEALRNAGGFDPQFRVAGDDVDACWRIEDAGGVIGFSHAAVVWHHRRPSIKTYFKQQRGYARAEALVARKWPSKYNRVGHLSWHGSLYGRGLKESLSARQRIYHGTWGTAPFQSIYERGETALTSLPLMPEWYFLVFTSLLLGLMSFDWPVLWPFLALGLAGLGVSVAMAVQGALRARFARVSESPQRAPEWKLRAIVFWLHLIQPAARLVGRIQHRLGPWSSGRLCLSPVPRARHFTLWKETWTDPSEILTALHDELAEIGTSYGMGGDHDSWDLAAGLSIYGEARALLLVEEHGGGRQYFRLRTWPVIFSPVTIAVVFGVSLSVAAFMSGAAVAGTVLMILVVFLAIAAYSALSAAVGTMEACARRVLAPKA